MRNRLVRGLVAALLAVGVVLPGSAQPARAEDISGPVITLVFTAVKFARGTWTQDDIEALVREVVGAATTARNEVVTHIDAHVAAVSLGQMDALLIEFTNYPNMRLDQRELKAFTSRALASASVDRRELGATQDLKAADAIGHALNVKYSMAEVAATEAGYNPESRALLRQRYIEANETILQKLEPTCNRRIVPDTPSHITETHVICTAANGEQAGDTQIFNEATGTWIEPEVNVEDLKLTAAVNSSWKVAKVTLPTLKQP